jgi:ABC-type transporter Mla subunit MlaD
MASERDPEGPAEQVARLYEQAETQAAEASERLVGSGGFASLLGQMAENAAALTKLGNDWMDLVLRNLRLASRRDLVRLSRQLWRTEDKLERVLQELEEVQDQLSQGEAKSSSERAARPSRTGKWGETEAEAEEQRPPP